MKILKRTSPLYEKIEKLEKFLQEENLQISIGAYGEINIKDTSFSETEFTIVDADSLESVSSLPTPFEYKLAPDVQD